MIVYFRNGKSVECDISPIDLYCLWQAVMSGNAECKIRVKLPLALTNAWLDIRLVDEDATFDDLLYNIRHPKGEDTEKP